MATIDPIATERPLVDLDTEVIVADRRYRKHLALRSDELAASRARPARDSLFLAINPAPGMLPGERSNLRCLRHGDDTFWFRFPCWLEPELNAAAWSSQSTSGALYLSRSDLYRCFRVSTVVLLQVLCARPGRACFTSRHYHRATFEVFHPLDGSGQTECWVPEQGWQRLPDDYEVAPGTIHQLRRVTPGFSVNLLQMHGPCRLDQHLPGNMLDMSDHIYV